MAELRWGAVTDSGRIRPGNEDNLLAEERVFVVADGMGGHRAGEVASALAVDLLRTRLSEAGATLHDVVGAVTEANGDIYRAAIANPDQQGMGTTVTALAVIEEDAPPDPPNDESTPPENVTNVPDPSAAEAEPGEGSASDEPDGPKGASDDGPTSDEAPQHQQLFALVNVGDSRTYLLRHGRLRRVTVDHSYVQELVATGHITDDEARTHPRRNIVTRALGIDPMVRVDAWTLPIVRGDRFLLCSDGLVDEVRDDEIVELLQAQEDPQQAAEGLVELANRQGGRDNITVVVVDVLEGAPPPDPDTELDLEPAWQDGTPAGTWAVDDPDGQPTEFADLAALVSGQSPEEAEAATTATGTTDGPPPTARPKRKRRLAGFLIALGVVAVLLLAFVIVATWARRSYFVAFDADNEVVIYRGQPDGFLWFNPTEDAPTALSRSVLDEASIERVEREPTFGSFGAAERFVAEQLATTTTTTTTTTTSTTSTTTTTTSTTVAP